MKRYSILHPFYMSFYSRDLYRDVAREWKGVAFGYLLLLLAVCWAPQMVKMHMGLSDFITKEAPGFVEQLPTFTFRQGELSIDRPSPYMINDPETGEPFVIIDTSGQTASFEGTGAKILITNKTAMIRKSEMETRTYDLSGINDFVIDHSLIYNIIETVRKWLVPAMYPFAVLFSFAYRILQVLVYALIGMLFANMLKASLNYQTLVRLSVIAVTPAIILSTLRSLTGTKVPLWSLICFAVAVGYLYFGVKAGAERESAS